MFENLAQFKKFIKVGMKVTIKNFVKEELSRDTEITIVQSNSFAMKKIKTDGKRETFKRAILNNASSIIICHNHPSGNTEPSDNDIMVMKRIKDAGRLIGIELADSTIITEDGKYYSFAEQGRIY